MDNYITLLTLALIFIFLLINVKNFVAAFCSISIMLLPLTYSMFLGGGVAGARGLGIVNIIWFANVGVFVFYILGKRSRLNFNKYFNAPFLIFFCLYFFGCLITYISGNDHTFYLSGYTNTDLIMKKIFRPLQFVFMGWMTMIVYQDSENRKIIKHSILYTAIILGMLAFFLFFSKSIGTGSSYRLGREAVGNIGMHPNTLGALCVYLYVITSTIEIKTGKFLKYMAIGCALIGIILSFSRISWLTTIIMTALILQNIKWPTKIVIIIIGVLLVFFFYGFIKNRVEFGTDYNRHSNISKKLNKISAGRTIIIWIPAIKMIGQRPVLGHGIGCNVKLKRGISPPHNAYLKILLDMGATGLVSLMVLMIYLYRRCKGIKTFQLLVVALFLLCLTGHSFYPHRGNYIIWIFYGIIITEYWDRNLYNKEIQN